MLPPVWGATYIRLLDQCYTRSEKSIVSPATIRRHLHHMDHPLDLGCHLLQYAYSPFEVEGEGEGEGELIAEVVVEMVGEAMVQMVRAIVVHLSRLCLLRYPPYLPLTFHTPTHLHITSHTPRHLHITFHTPRHLHIFTISGVARASVHGSGYHLLITPFIIPYIASHR